MFNGGYVLVFEIAVLLNPISARFCEEGYICSSPKECCQEGCCYAAPRTPPATTDHVFKLFFYNHWYFWCVMFAIILAILCACSLWRKRRQLCGWGSPGPHSQSGDSAGSCYAPPQYSRCTSFHHAPPPYTEVTSKPDLYPLVFTCNSDNGKNGASYVMVQYFRNYIVRPAGSLSATSTVDSLSSSFICTANEANTLIPPPYSRAASPDLPINASSSSITAPIATSNAYATMPRSASQHSYSLENHTHNNNNNNNNTNHSIVNNNNNNNNFNKNNQYNFHHLTYQQHNNPHHSSYRPVSLYARNETATNTYNNQSQMRLSESVNFQNIRLNKLENSNNTVILSQSDQQFRYILNNNNNNNNQNNENNINTENIVSNSCNNINEYNNNNNNNIINLSFPTNNNCDIATNNQSINQTNNNNNNKCAQNTNDNISNNNNNNNNSKNGKNAIYNSCGSSIEAISITVPVTTDCNERDYKDLDMLRRSLETCCQILQKQQQHNQNQQITKIGPAGNNSGTSTEQNLIGSQNYNENASSYSEGTQQVACNLNDDSSRLKKFDSYVNSTTCSAVSSLINIESSPGSPPQATSPTTGEVKELLEQIRLLQQNENTHKPAESIINDASTTSRSFDHQPAAKSSSPQQSLQSPSNPSTSFKFTTTSMTTAAAPIKRPSTLQNRKEFFSKSKTRYFPILPSSSPHTKTIRSPIGFGMGNSIIGGGGGGGGGGNNFGGFSNSSGISNFNLLTRNRGRKGWISRSAPTTPGTALPPTCFLDDDSPLLNEHDEDAEQNA